MSFLFKFSIMYIKFFVVRPERENMIFLQPTKYQMNTNWHQIPLGGGHRNYIILVN